MTSLVHVILLFLRFQPDTVNNERKCYTTELGCLCKREMLYCYTFPQLHIIFVAFLNLRKLVVLQGPQIIKCFAKVEHQAMSEFLVTISKCYFVSAIFYFWGGDKSVKKCAWQFVTFQIFMIIRLKLYQHLPMTYKINTTVTTIV